MYKLHTVKSIGTGTQHYLMNGDNVLILPKLLKLFTEKIDIIYIDPPYNTGKKMGKYSDNFKTHQIWLDFMKPRLILARQLLSDVGVIFISIGEQEEAYLKIQMDELFGEQNKIATIIWQSKHTVSNDKQGITSQTEYILVYAKDSKKVIFNSDPLRDEYVNSVYKNPDNDPRGLWRGGVQLYKKKNPISYTVVSPTGKEWTLPWNYSESQWYNVLVKEDLIYWGKDGNSCPVKKVFLKDTKGVGIKNLWLGEDVGYTSNGGDVLELMFGNRNEFLYPKPVSLIRRILQISAKPHSIVLDFFAGSGTTGHAVLEYNKDYNTAMQFILITNNENNICSHVTLPRLQNIISGYTDTKGIIHDPIEGKLTYYELKKDNK